MAEIKELPATFEADYAGGIKMTLRRLEPWHWSAVTHRVTRAVAAIREGSIAVERYGFDPEEFEVLADPSSWEGFSDYITAVELGVMAIIAWNFTIEGAAAPPKFDIIARLMRIREVRDKFMLDMDRDGNRTVLVAEGNA